jgi:hypothetical protein
MAIHATRSIKATRISNLLFFERVGLDEFLKNFSPDKDSTNFVIPRIIHGIQATAELMLKKPALETR